LARFVATIVFSYLAFTANKENLKNEVFIYIALTLLFQPFLKISLGRMIWNVVGAVVSIGLIVSLASSKKPK
jgi:hypothetical protein